MGKVDLPLRGINLESTTPPDKNSGHPNRCPEFLVGEGGFEPPKSLTTDLQSAPFGHSGIPPYSVFEYLPLDSPTNLLVLARRPSEAVAERKGERRERRAVFRASGKRNTASVLRRGAGRRTRTPDLLITNQLLYQLSYTSIATARMIIAEGVKKVNCFSKYFRRDFTPPHLHSPAASAAHNTQ